MKSPFLLLQEWLEYLDTLFPCSRIVLNLRRDRQAQARAVLSSFFATKDPLDASVPPLSLVENELEAVSQFLLEWHQNKSSTGRSFLMYTEEMTSERFTHLAQWLGRPCTFGSVPNANELDAKQELPYFHSSSQPPDVTCSPQAKELQKLPTYLAPDGQTRVVTDTAPDSSFKNQRSDAYEALLHEHDEQCYGVETLTHNQVCSPAELSEGSAEQPQSDLVKQAAVSQVGVDLSSTRKQGDIDVSHLPSFYIHEDGLFNFTDSVQCLMDAVGLNKDVDSFDDRLVPDLAEHMADWWLLEQFRRHPARVNSPEEAKLHVIGSAFTTAYRAHRTRPLARRAPHSPRTQLWRTHLPARRLRTLPSRSALLTAATPAQVASSGRA